LQTNPKDDWSSYIFYPFIKSKKEESEIGENFKKVKTSTLDAI